jgi:hypothetical protein
LTGLESKQSAIEGDKFELLSLLVENPQVTNEADHNVPPGVNHSWERNLTF